MSETGKVTTSSFMSIVPGPGASMVVSVSTLVLFMVVSLVESVLTRGCAYDDRSPPWTPLVPRASRRTSLWLVEPGAGRGSFGPRRGPDVGVTVSALVRAARGGAGLIWC